jgi:hypothetical protein
VESKSLTFVLLSEGHDVLCNAKYMLAEMGCQSLAASIHFAIQSIVDLGKNVKIRGSVRPTL